MTASDKDLDYIFKIIFLGDSFVGKTNIILKFYSNTFSTNSKSTVGVEFYAKVLQQDNKNIKVQLWDTAGQERFNKYVVTDLKIRLGFGNEREHTPVNEVRAVTLGRIFKSDICRAAEHSLAGSSLLTS